MLRALPIRVRELRSADALAHADALAQAGLVPGMLDAHLAVHGNAAFASELGDTAIGVLMLIGHTSPAGRYASREAGVRHIHVLPPYHGLGAAQALMNAALHHAMAHGVRRLWLSLPRCNSRALAFFHKYGFHEAASSMDAVNAMDDKCGVGDTLLLLRNT